MMSKSQKKWGRYFRKIWAGLVYSRRNQYFLVCTLERCVSNWTLCYELATTTTLFIVTTITWQEETLTRHKPQQKLDLLAKLRLNYRHTVRYIKTINHNWTPRLCRHVTISPHQIIKQLKTLVFKTMENNLKAYYYLYTQFTMK